MLTSSRLLAGRYRLLAPVGEGGMAIVHRARDELLGRDVAVKLLKPAFADDPDFVRRFRREARHAAQLHHPNVVTIHDLGTDPETGADYIVMQLVDGPSLDVLLADGRPLPLGRALRIGSETADALQAAHDQGIVHRDVKPGNILVDRDGTVRVADFGIARAAGADGATTAGVVVGSPDYISPEHVVGDAVTPASDIYSLGVVLYQMVTGQRPFHGPSAAATALQRLRMDPPRPATVGPVPDEVEDIVRRAMAREPADRYPSAEALSAALEGFRIAHLGGVRRSGSRTRAGDTQWIPVSTTVADPIDPTDEVGPFGAVGGPEPVEGPEPVALPRADRERRRRRPAALVAPLIVLVAFVLGALALAGGNGDRRDGSAAASAPAGPSGRAVPPVAVVPSGSPSAIASPSPSPTPSATSTPAPTPKATPEPTPPPTQRPTPAPTATPRPAVTARSPADTVRSFYILVARHDFDAAARLWSASMRRRYPPAQYIDGRFAPTTGITLRRVETTAQSGSTATVAVDLIESRSDGSTRHWVGSWDLVKSSGRWLMNQPHF
jgi:serine/threonine-protein kinase